MTWDQHAVPKAGPMAAKRVAARRTSAGWTDFNVGIQPVAFLWPSRTSSSTTLGVFLGADIAYYAFLSLFPLLLLLTTVLGFVLAGSPGLQRDVVDSALAQPPVVGAQLEHPAKIGGGR